MELLFFIKNIFSKRKLRKINKIELLEKLKEKYLNDNIIDLTCPKCCTNLGSFSNNYLTKYWEVFCPECKENIWITMNNIYIEDSIFKEKDIFETHLTDDEIYELYLKGIKITKKEIIKDKEI